MIKINNYELTTREESVLKSALDIYVRILQGQFSALSRLFFCNNIVHIKKSVLKDIEKHFDDAQIILFGNASQYWKIGNNLISRSAVLAYRLELLIDGDVVQADSMLDLMGWNDDTNSGLSGEIKDG